MNTLLKTIIAFKNLKVPVWNHHAANNPYVKRLLHEIDRLTELANLYDRLPEKPNYLSIEGLSSIVIQITDFKDLHRAIQFIRCAIPQWKYHLSLIWAVGSNTAFAAWEDKNYPNIELWLKTSIDQFPEELKGEKCHFAKTTHESVSYVCET